MPRRAKGDFLSPYHFKKLQLELRLTFDGKYDQDHPFPKRLIVELSNKEIPGAPSFGTLNAFFTESDSAKDWFEEWIMTYLCQQLPEKDENYSWELYQAENSVPEEFKKLEGGYLDSPDWHERVTDWILKDLTDLGSSQSDHIHQNSTNTNDNDKDSESSSISHGESEATVMGGKNEKEQKVEPSRYDIVADKIILAIKKLSERHVLGLIITSIGVLIALIALIVHWPEQSLKEDAKSKKGQKRLTVPDHTKLRGSNRDDSFHVVVLKLRATAKCSDEPKYIQQDIKLKLDDVITKDESIIVDTLDIMGVDLMNYQRDSLGRALRCDILIWGKYKDKCYKPTSVTMYWASFIGNKEYIEYAQSLILNTDADSLEEEYSIAMSHIVNIVLGEKYIKNKDFEGAFTTYNQMLEAHPECALAPVKQAKLYAKFNKLSHQDYYSVLQKAYSVDSGDFSLNQLMGLWYTASQDYTKALHYYNKMHVEGGSGNAYYYYSIGELEYLRRNYEKAKEHLVLAAELKPNNPHILSLLGSCYISLGEDTTKAVELHERAYKLAPRNVYIMRHLANAYWQVFRDLSSAREMAKKAFELDPTNWQNVVEYAELCFKKKDTVNEIPLRGRSLFIWYLKHNSEDNAIRNALAGYYMKTLKIDSCVYHLKKALENDTINYFIYLNLATVLWNFRRDSEAFQYYNKAEALYIKYHNDSSYMRNLRPTIFPAVMRKWKPEWVYAPRSYLKKHGGFIKIR